MRKLFFETNPTWPRVLIFAVAAAVVTALALTIPAVAESSAANIGVTIDCWIVFALLIILNCGNPSEAGVKTFVFFLVSQPLIYLLRVPFSDLGWQIFRYYPRWGVMTVLTFPGAMLAWYVKKDNLLSALILSVATGYLAFACVNWLADCVRRFPYGLIAAIFCGVCAAGFVFLLLQNRRARLLCGSITLLAALITAAWSFIHVPVSYASYALPHGHDWQISGITDMVGETGVSGGDLVIAAKSYGTETVYLEDENGETLTVQIEYSGRNGVVITEPEGE